MKFLSFRMRDSDMYARYRSLVNELRKLVFSYVDLRVIRIIIAAIMYSISLIGS